LLGKEDFFGPAIDKFKFWLREGGRSEEGIEVKKGKSFVKEKFYAGGGGRGGWGKPTQVGRRAIDHGDTKFREERGGNRSHGRSRVTFEERLYSCKMGATWRAQKG